MPDCFHLRCDLLYNINKVVDFRVQFGTLQKHGFQLFDARVHLSICTIRASTVVKKVFRSFTYVNVHYNYTIKAHDYKLLSCIQNYSQVNKKSNGNICT